MLMKQSSPYNIITLDNVMSNEVIHDVVIRSLTVNRDDRGSLTECLKTSWNDVYDEKHLPFAQMYYSKTLPGVARDEDQWHFHPGGQQDRFGVISGDIVVGLYDNREGSESQGLLNLFWLGERLGDTGQYLLVIPPRVLHGYVVVSDEPATMFNFPSRLYDPAEEERIDMAEIQMRDGEPFSWEKVNTAYLQAQV
jgi:dTDP-4-dehydrorhamnose 3,5-epimerase